MRTSYPMVCLLALGTFVFPTAALADSVSPASFSAEVDVGESVTVHKIVTVDTAPPVDALVDVFMLTDSTGSMGGAINAVKSSATSIVNSTAGSGNVQFGAGEYKDVGDVFVYRTNANLTSNVATVQAGINAWFASGGGDFPEANLFGLYQVANTVSWRPGSTRILVWFGDAPGTNPSNGITEATATSALVSKGIAVQALNLASLDSTGQATRITLATHGTLYNGVNTSSIVSTIQSSITSALLNYSSVGLDLSGVPAGMSATTGSPFTGLFNRGSVRTFEFDVVFTGLVAGHYDFQIPALVDSGVVARESDSIDVKEPGEVVPTPPSCSLTGVVAGPPKALEITVQDAGEGIASIEVTTADNATVDVPVFSAGDKDPLMVIATKVDESAGSLVALRVTDVNGAVTDCDPVVPGDEEPSASDASGGEAAGGCTVAAPKGGLSGLSLSLVGLAAVALLRRRRPAHQ